MLRKIHLLPLEKANFRDSPYSVETWYGEKSNENGGDEPPPYGGKDENVTFFSHFFFVRRNKKEMNKPRR